MFNFPSCKRETFKRHFILNATLEARFSESVKSDWEKVESQLRPSLGQNDKLSFIKSADFKLSEKGHLKESSELEVNSRTIGLKIDCKSKEDPITVAIHSDRVVFTTKSYVGFESFWSSLDHYLTTITKLLQVKGFRWLGIRKINSVSFQPNDGIYRGEGFNPELFEVLKNGGPLSSEHLKTGEQAFVLSEGNKTAVVRVKFSLNQNNSYSIFVDLDLNISDLQVTDRSELLSVAKPLNNDLFSLFCWAVDPELLDEMRKE